MRIFKTTLRSHLWTSPLALAGAALILANAQTAHAAVMQEASSDDWLSAILSPYVIGILLVLVIICLIAYKRSRRHQEVEEPVPSPAKPRQQSPDRTHLSPQRNELAMTQERNTTVIEGAQVWEKPTVEASIFGAYRIDQEVNNLVAGKAHRMDVMASRASEDRRAIEASLIKALESSETSEEGRRRARTALEEYGFVARQSATMLMGRDAWERSSAARTLGQIGVTSSLSFLIEALHDSDAVVRNQAIASLGSLKMPSAIGALLDIARRHPDIPASLLSETLSECSVESLGFLDAPSTESGMLSGANSDGGDFDNFASFKELPDGADDDALTAVMVQLESSDEQVRSASARELASFPTKRSVDALTSLVADDPDDTVRSAAVASLGTIDHESVLGGVLIALADDSRTVKASAARIMSGLNFDRADAYVRVMETADPQLLQRVARACDQTGIAKQAVDRLASEDRHQAYEAFSLFSLLARGGETGLLTDIIRHHRDEEVRLCAIRVLGLAGQTSVVPKLRELAGHQSMSENLRTALLEVLYKLDQDEPLPDLSVSDNEAVSLHNSP